MVSIDNMFNTLHKNISDPNSPNSILGYRLSDTFSYKHSQIRLLTELIVYDLFIKSLDYIYVHSIFNLCFETFNFLIVTIRTSVKKYTDRKLN